jgi:hypothetical protein
MKPILLIIGLFSASSPYQQNFDTVKIKTTKITNSVYMLEGSGGNIGVLVGVMGSFW